MRLSIMLLLTALLSAVGCSDTKPVAQAPANLAPVEPETKPVEPAPPTAEMTAPLESPYTKPSTETLSDVPVIPTPAEMEAAAAQREIAAQQKTAAAAGAAQSWTQELAPLVDDTTVVVIRIDWPNPDLLGILDELKSNGADLSFLEEPMIDAVLNNPDFAKGVSEIALLLHTLQVDRGDGTITERKASTPLLHVTGAVTDEELTDIIFTDLIADMPPAERKAAFPRQGEWLVLGLQPGISERMAMVKPSDPQQLEAAVAAIGPAPIQVIGLLNAGSRAYLIENGEIPGGQIAKYYLDKINFAGTSVAYAQGAKINVVADTLNKEDAQELYDWVDLTTQPGVAPAEIPAPLLELARKYLLPKMNDNQLSISLDAAQITDIRKTVEPAIAAARTSAMAAGNKMRSVNNMKQIALAFHNFHDTYGMLPPASLPVGKNGEQLLSWRVYLLPFLEQSTLYDQFHLDEPWDSEHNLKLAEHVMEVYADPAKPLKDPRMTTYLVPQGKDAFSTGDGKSIGFRDFTDGTSNTIMLLNVAPAEAVIWTKPDDWKFDPENPFRGLDNQNPEGRFEAGLVDGSVQKYSTKNLKPETMRNLIQRNDGNRINQDELN